MGTGAVMVVVRVANRQLHAFLADRLDGAGPCRVSESLPYSALAGTSALAGARTLMAELEGGGCRLTVTGNLSRTLVATLMDGAQWEGCDIDDLRALFKVVNANVFPPAMYLHAVLRLAGLARQEKRSLKLTKKGRALLPEGEAGRRHAMLMRTTFAGYNLAYLDGFDGPDVFAPQISLILYLLGRLCDDWHPAEDIMRGAILPTTQPEEREQWRTLAAAFRARVLRYLCWFGLMESRWSAANDDWAQQRLYRKTALYDLCLDFPGLR